MKCKLFEVAKVDKDTEAKIRTVRQNAEAKAAAAERIAKIEAFAASCLAADAPATKRESWIFEAICDLVNKGRSYSAREYEVLTRALRNVRREIACQRAAD